jgi:hypothetical protein
MLLRILEFSWYSCLQWQSGIATYFFLCLSDAADGRASRPNPR